MNQPARYPSRYRYVLLLALVAAGLVLGYFVLSKWQSRTTSEEFTVEPPNVKIVPVTIQEGEWIDLSVFVMAGSPVDIVISQEARMEDGQIIVKGAILYDVTEAGKYQFKWQYPGPAFIVITPADWSRVRVQVEVR